MEVYAAQIDRMDQNVGAILDALRAAGRSENTLILFLADNGGCAEDLPAGRLDNNHVPETDARRPRRCVPATYPSIMPGRRRHLRELRHRLGQRLEHAVPPLQALGARRRHRDAADRALAGQASAAGNAITHEPGHLIDLMATCVDVVGRAVSRAARRTAAILPMEGRSLRPAFQAETSRRDDAIYWEHEGNRAVVDGQAGSWCRASRIAGSCTTWRPTAASCTTSQCRTLTVSRA